MNPELRVRNDRRTAVTTDCFGHLIEHDTGFDRPVGPAWQSRTISQARPSVSGYVATICFQGVAHLDADVLAEPRSRAGRRELSAHVNEAVHRPLQHGRLAALLTQMEAVYNALRSDSTGSIAAARVAG